MRLKRFLLVLLLVISVSFFNPSVYGLEKPHQYFDWNRYSVVDGRVLGETTSSTSVKTNEDYKNFKRPKYFFGFLTNTASDNPFYFLKKMEEGLSVNFTFDSQKREEKRLNYAAERLAEIEQLSNKGKSALASNLASDYEDLLTTVAQNISNMKRQGRDIKKLLSIVDIEASRHTLVLEELALKLPPQAESGIKTALSASEQVVDAAADGLGKPAIPEELVQRLQSLKAQGLLSPEEVTKLIGVDSRRKAREELRKYTQAGLLPEADFKKLDESARNYFPTGYMTIIEVKKFNELKQLETQKPDEQTLKRLQEFAKEYKQGEVVPTELRRYWVPMVRIEELQNTVRPDLISEDFFKYRPEEKQKYQEVVERMKPKKEDVEYINQLVQQNSNLLNDPSFARIKAIADKFGSSESSEYQSPVQRSCSFGSHWVNISFMPEGGYCAPNYNYSVSSSGEIKDSPCPPSYHRSYPGSPCLPDNPNGSGITGSLPAAGSCPAGYSWKTETSTFRGGYCSPDYTTSSTGGYPGGFAVPGYCPQGKIFREGKCYDYSPPPANGCLSGSYWNGEKCVAPKECGPGYYQDYSGECKSSSQEYERYKNKCTGREMPSEGCGGGGWWDMETCSCKTGGGNYGCPPPASGCTGGKTWDKGTCTCRPDCPSGTAWNGSNCMTNSGPQVTPGSWTSCSPPTSGCTGGMNWDRGTCTCRPSCASGTTWNGSYCMTDSSSGSGGGSAGGNYYSPSAAEQEAACRAGGGICVSFVNGACGCERPGSTSQNNWSNCGSGYYWTGSHCASSSESSSPSPYPSQPPSNQSQPQPQPTSVPPPPPESQPTQPPSEPQPTSAPPPPETQPTQPPSS